jgi:endoglucanase
MRKESLEFLKELLAAPTPSGYESPGQRIWCQYARQVADEVRTDAYGNAVAVLNPQADPRIMVDGHVDEIGLIVKYIDDKGFIYFQRIGGVDPALVRGKRVNIHTAKRIVHGVIGAVPIHLQERGKEPKVPKMHECFIDIGARDKAEAMERVAVGDPITFVDDFEMLDKNIAVARAFDDRAGSWTVIEALRLAAHGRPACAVYACNSIQEEVGGAGAAMNVFNLNPHAAIAVDVTHATDSPGIDAKEHGEIKLGGGPSVWIGRECHPVLVERIRSVARHKRIKLQTEAFSLTGGTNAMVMHNKQGGIPSAVLGPPTRYLHTTVELMDLRDLERTAELLAAVVLDVKKGERFKVKV